MPEKKMPEGKMSEKKKYAIVKTGGKQYRVEQGKTILVEKIKGEPGEEVTLSEVLLVSDPENGVKIGTPTVAGAAIKTTILALVKSKKVVSFKKRIHKGFKVKKGHRQQKTELLIDGIQD